MKKIKKHRVTNNKLSEIIKESDSVAEVMRKAFPKQRAGAGRYKRIAKLMEERDLRFRNGNKYFYTPKKVNIIDNEMLQLPE